MTTLKMHYEGWISLPSDLRQQLGLHSGTRLDVQLVDGAIVLRPAKGTRAPTDPEAAIEPPAVASAPAPSLETALPQKRPRGRPRKVPTLERPAEPMLGTAGRSPALAQAQAGTAAEGPRRSGRARRRARAFVRGGRGRAVEAAAESGAAGEQALSLFRPPPRRPEPSRTGGSHEREERRPFRNVEVRKLGPGRRHNRLQRGMNPTG